MQDRGHLEVSPVAFRVASIECVVQHSPNLPSFAMMSLNAVKAGSGFGCAHMAPIDSRGRRLEISVL